MTPAPAPRDRMSVVIVGHVDHGKSTLIGRLFHDAGSLPEGRHEAIREMCARRGMPFEWAFLTDALQGERDQGVTIDAAHIWFSTARRDYRLIDAPGHREFLRNAIAGAAQADAAILIVDAAEGVCEQSRRHCYLLRMLGIRQIVAAVNKIDRAGYDRAAIAGVERDIRAYLRAIGIEPRRVVPISARGGDNVAARSPRTPWYDGPTILEALDLFEPAPAETELPLRLPVQDVYKFDDRRIVVGRILTGALHRGDAVLFSPSNETARVKRFESWPGPAPVSARAGESVGLTLDRPVFVERGETISHAGRPPLESDVFRARLFWLHETPLAAGARYVMRANERETGVAVQKIEKIIDPDDLSARPARAVERNAVAEAVLRADRMIAFDPHDENPRAGRFVLVAGHRIAGGGVMSLEGYADQRPLLGIAAPNLSPEAPAVTAAERARRNGHRGGVVWLTGLSGAGKSTLARAAEAALFARGYRTYVLDGDNVRAGLNANLGFSPRDRAENIRRIGEAAALFADAGILVLAAFISPYRSDRARARRAAERLLGPGAFHEVHVRADLATCEARDPKGLYKRARAGEIPDFTGLDAPYEEPEAPDLAVDTRDTPIADSTEAVVRHVLRAFSAPP